MSEPLTIYADFNNADEKGRLRLVCHGTIDDLAAAGCRLREGLELSVSDGELTAEATVVRSSEEGTWVAVIDWRRIRSDR